MKCKDCPHWQRNGDCYRIIGELEPKLFSCVGEGDMKFRVPFDPHDIKYFMHQDYWFGNYYADAIAKAKATDGIEVVKVREKDVIYHANGEEGIGKVTLYYFKTKGDYACGC